MSQYNTILLLGSNIGDKKKNILTATSEIEKRIGKINKKSKILETIPIEFCSLNNFFNFAIEITTKLSPIFLLSEIKSIEKEMGRIKDSVEVGGYKDRIIDIDIVTFLNINYKSKTLKIPHIKHIKEREFSKILLKELK